MLHSLSLGVPSLSIAHPSWLFANTCNLLGHTGLFVYRSVFLRVTDAMFAPVKKVLDSDRVEIVVQEEVEDAMMMFGRGEWTTYLLLGGGLSAPAPGAPTWDELVEEAEEQIQLLTKHIAC